MWLYGVPSSLGKFAHGWIEGFHIYGSTHSPCSRQTVRWMFCSYSTLTALRHGRPRLQTACRHTAGTRPLWIDPGKESLRSLVPVAPYPFHVPPDARGFPSLMPCPTAVGRRSALKRHPYPRCGARARSWPRHALRASMQLLHPQRRQPCRNVGTWV